MNHEGTPGGGTLVSDYSYQGDYDINYIYDLLLYFY